MIVLYQNHVVQTRAVVYAATGAYRGLLQCAQPRRRLASIQYFGRMISDRIHGLACQRCHTAKALQKIQCDAFGFENRARKNAHLNDDVAGDDGSSIRVLDLDIGRRIDPPKNFRSSTGAGNDRWLTSNDAACCVQPLGNEKLGGYVPVADIFLERSRERIVIFRMHEGAEATRYREMQARLSNTPLCYCALNLGKKKIRAAHAKEKQLPEELVQLPESP